MHLQQRIALLIKLGQYITAGTESWRAAMQKASGKNTWFTLPFIDQAASAVATQYLDEGKLEAFVAQYNIPDHNPAPVTVGLVMAGNIPLVGFHDWLCIFLSGNYALVKSSAKDDVLFPHLAEQLCRWDSGMQAYIAFAEQLKGCDAYIATGSNNTGRYFDYYFGRYPHIIRRNKTSVAVLTGDESVADLDRLSDDINLYFGLGCRNVTKLYVPEGYDFVPLLASFKKYTWFADHNKYRNNYDYQLALHQLNQKYYMTDGVVLLSANRAVFSPISQLNYEHYTGEVQLAVVRSNKDIQCITGANFTRFGKAQHPSLMDFADGTDTMRFLLQQKK